MRTILALCLFTIITTSVKSQSHNMDVNYNCRLQKKGYFFNSEKFACPACDAKEKKEKAAIEAEDDRRMAVHNAKVKADREAAIRANLEKRRLADEAARIKREQELADNAAHETAMKRYREIASKGTVNSNLKGKALDQAISSNITPFSDNQKRTYGFKINNEEVLSFPFEERTTTIDRIKNSDLFAVNVWKTLPNGWEKYSYSFIMDYTGKKISVDGSNTFEYKIEQHTDQNKIAVYKKLAAPDYVGSTARGSNALFDFYKSKEAALAARKANQRAGWDMFGEAYACYEACYYLDLKGDLLEKINGYKLRIIE